MFKRLAVILFIILTLLPIVCLAYKNENNGKLEAWDKEARGASSAGISKRGLYMAPEYRYELMDGLTPDEVEHDGGHSIYFYPDGTPRPGTYRTAEEIKADEEREKERLKRAREEYLREQEEKARQKELERQKYEREDQRFKYEFSIYFYMLLVATVMSILSNRESLVQHKSKFGWFIRFLSLLMIIQSFNCHNHNIFIFGAFFWVMGLFISIGFFMYGGSIIKEANGPKCKDKQKPILNSERERYMEYWKKVAKRRGEDMRYK